MLTEKKSNNKLFWSLNLPTCRDAALTLLAFLQKQDIDALCEAVEGLEGRHFLASLAQNVRFINKYINVADKSLYFTFCEEEQYKKIEVQQVAAISRKHPGLFSRYEKGFGDVLKCLREQVPVVQQDLSTLLDMVVNPDLPLPQLKRQTQGIFCTSPFQLFLVHSTFNEEEQDFYSPFQNLQAFLTLDKEEEYLKQFMLILKDKAKGGIDIKKIIKVRYTPYEITASNFTDFLLEGNELHNFVVGLFALTDNLLEAIYQYLNLIEDPLHKLVELTLRYNIYRNYVLAVEEMLAFVFNIYDNIYRETIEESTSKPKYKFWRPAMTKWFLRMDSLHSEAQQVYMHCFTKLRNNKLKETLTELCLEDQLRYGRLLQLVEGSRFQYELGQKTSSKGGSEVSSFFDEFPDNYEVVVMEFNEYLVDISVNEQTVHWCGHSEHQLQQPYLDYQQALSELSLSYYKSMIGEKEVSKEDISQMAKIDTDYISCLQIKNRTLKKIMDDLNKTYQLEEELALNGNFQEKDSKLEYFNHKALILAVVDQHARPFYSIPPHYSPDKLIDMIDTNDSASNNSESEFMEYLSESEGEQNGEKQGKRGFSHFDSDEEEVVEKGSRKEMKTNKRFFDQYEDTATSTMTRSVEDREQPN